MSKTISIKNNFFILTGGPGSGKTSVLEALKNCGYVVVPEVARSIIKEQQSFGGEATHAGNRIAFCNLMLNQSVTDYKNHLIVPQTVFFDRGIPDLYGYAKRFCNGITEEIEQATKLYRYNPTVFLFPPWPEIYNEDTERKQDFNEAMDTYQVVKEAYKVCGYQIIEIPKTTINERVEYILQRLIPLQVSSLYKAMNG